MGSGLSNQTTNMGSCTVEALCSSDQALFDLELATSAEASHPAIYTHDIDWHLDYHDYDKRAWDPLLLETDYIEGDFNLGSVYQTIECVPSTECALDFNMSTASPVDRYVVTRNGVVLISYEVREPWEVTPFGKECTRAYEKSSKLSGGAIAGIVIACVAVVVAAVFGYNMWYKKRQL